MDLYSEIILDHYKKPHNKGDLQDADISIHEENPLCGDKIKIDIKLNDEQKVEKVGFVGTGCAISQAATSMLTDYIIGKTPEEIKAISNDEIIEMLGVPISAGRIKCALLGLVTIKKAAILLTHAKKETPPQA